MYEKDNSAHRSENVYAMEPLTDSPFRLRHEIFVLDAHLKQPLSPMERKQHAQKFIDDTLHILKMEPLGFMQFHDAVDDRAPGWSFIQTITTSHVSAHYFEKPGKHPHIRIDFYSCQSVNWRKVVEMSHRFCDLADWNATFISREIGEDTGRQVLDIQGDGDRVVSENKLMEPKTAHMTESAFAPAAV